jgi:hypothetical protein
MGFAMVLVKSLNSNLESSICQSTAFRGPDSIKKNHGAADTWLMEEPK